MCAVHVERADRDIVYGFQVPPPDETTMSGYVRNAVRLSGSAMPTLPLPIIGLLAKEVCVKIHGMSSHVPQRSIQ